MDRPRPSRRELLEAAEAEAELREDVIDFLRFQLDVYEGLIVDESILRLIIQSVVRFHMAEPHGYSSNRTLRRRIAEDIGGVLRVLYHGRVPFEVTAVICTESNLRCRYRCYHYLQNVTAPNAVIQSYRNSRVFCTVKVEWGLLY